MFEKWQYDQRRGILAAGKQFFRRNPDGLQGKIGPFSGQKVRRLGVLTFFKQGQILPAKGFGGKDSVKENRQGCLSRPVKHWARRRIEKFCDGLFSAHGDNHEGNCREI